ncbi:MAG: orotidine-5'-phosphate decarboxylase [Phycisphaerales bacterium]|jgi:orotidine-5'-phosphate decarboxylase|nr:orotidine-5'-phosphate decarboxylase [Phycisphaerales bacterium]
MAEASHPADRLIAAVEHAGSPVCVGIDPVLSRLPSALSRDVEGVGVFCRGIIDAVVGEVAAVKFQSACFEALGWKAMSLLAELRSLAHQEGLQVILDAKRNDIGISAGHYAAAATADGAPCDWVTVNPWLGEDGIVPFLEAGLGVFALVRTSNPSGDSVQAQTLTDGRTVAESVADLIAELGNAWLGKRGYSALGAVVGATKPDEVAVLRRRMPHQLFLMPGFGAQGGTPQGVVPALGADGCGVLVTASRSVIYAEGDDWQQAIADAARAMSASLQSLSDAVR